MPFAHSGSIPIGQERRLPNSGLVLERRGPYRERWLGTVEVFAGLGIGFALPGCSVNLRHHPLPGAEVPAGKVQL